MRTKFGVSQVMNHPPKWLVPAFSIAMVLIGVVSYLISGDPLISDEFKLRFNHYLNGLTILLSGIAPFFGVKAEPKK